MLCRRSDWYGSRGSGASLQLTANPKGSEARKANDFRGYIGVRKIRCVGKELEKHGAENAGRREACGHDAVIDAVVFEAESFYREARKNTDKTAVANSGQNKSRQKSCYLINSRAEEQHKTAHGSQKR